MPNRLSRSVVAAISLSLCSFESQAFCQSSFPPQRTGFDLRPTAPVLLGKLWTDIGLFYSFNGNAGTTRNEWESKFFELMNQSTLPNHPLRLLAAQALGDLRDPGAFVIPENEGRGDYFLPVLFEAKPDGSIWLTGGSRDELPRMLGPIDQINGESLARFLSPYAGGSPSPAQAASVLSTASVKTSPFTWEIRFKDGSSRTLHATKELPKDLWVDGDWDGTPLQSLPKLSADELAKVRRVDLRIAPWLRSGALSKSLPLDTVWAALKKLALPKEAFKIARQNTGYPDGSRDGAFSSKVVLEAVPFVPQKDASIVFSLRWPQGGAVPTAISRALAGWALDPAYNAVATQTRYRLQEVDIVFPTAVFVRSGSYLPAASPAPSKGEQVSVGFENGSHLNRTAAKALASASILNFDHLYGFTPEVFQEPFARGVLGLSESVTDVPQLIMRTSAFAHDPHTHIVQANGGIRVDPLEKERHPSTPPTRFHPFFGLCPDLETYLVMNLNDVEGLKLPIHVGAHIYSIEGIPIQEWLKRAEAINPGRPDDPMRRAFELNYCTPSLESLKIEFANPGEPRQTQSIPTIKGKSYVEASLFKPSAALPQGWTLINQPEQISGNDLIERMQKGENFILDYRVYDVLKDPITKIVNINEYSWIKTPSSPCIWGSSSTTIVFQAASYRIGDPANAPTGVSGRAVVLVWGSNQSSMETMPLSIRTGVGLEGRVFLVGLPTAGVTGPITTVRLPVGEEKGFAYYTPTGAWPVFRGGLTIQYRGLPLDYRVPMADLLRKMASGRSTDPLLECVVDHLPNLPQSSTSWW